MLNADVVSTTLKETGWYDNRSDKVSFDEFMHLMESLGPLADHRDADARRVTTLKATAQYDGQVGYAGMSSKQLNMHTDGSGNKAPPRFVALYLAESPTEGGVCLRGQVRKICQDLKANHPEALDAASDERACIFNSGNEQYIGPIFRKDTKNDKWLCRFRDDEQAFFSAKLCHYVPEIREAISRHTDYVNLTSGHFYVADNARWLHGRTSFLGDRIAMRVQLEDLNI